MQFNVVFISWPLFKQVTSQYWNHNMNPTLPRSWWGIPCRAGRHPRQPCQAEGKEGTGRPRRGRVGGQEQEGQGSHHHILWDLFVRYLIKTKSIQQKTYIFVDLTDPLQWFLDTQVSLAPTHVSPSVRKLVGWSYFWISIAPEHFCATVDFETL